LTCATAIEISEVGWSSAKDRLSAIRTAVFIHEQHVPPELEWDDQDQSARHLLAHDLSGRDIACARVLTDGSIGRMAVLAGWRQQGVGSALLQAAIALCVRNRWGEIRLSAQTHAIGFYEKSGFITCSEEYLDAGIPHRNMRFNHSLSEAIKHNLSI
jgi:predicted GNAT family N-acyltransferase